MQAIFNDTNYIPTEAKFPELADKILNQSILKIKDIVESNQIPPRSYDVYLGEIELAVERFEKEFPKLEKPTICEHEKTGLRLKTHVNNTTHVVTQCLICGGLIKDHKKSIVEDWESLP